MGMISGRLKSLLVAGFSIFFGLSSLQGIAQEHHEEGGQPSTTHEEPKKKKLFDANEVIFGHIMDAHEFHFLSYGPKDHKKHVTIPLPVILYSPQRGLTTFMSSKFHHGHADYKGYRILTEHNRAEMGLDPKKYFIGSIVPVTADGKLDTTVKV